MIPSLLAIGKAGTGVSFTAFNKMFVDHQRYSGALFLYVADEQTTSELCSKLINRVGRDRFKNEDYEAITFVSAFEPGAILEGLHELLVLYPTRPIRIYLDTSTMLTFKTTLDQKNGENGVEVTILDQKVHAELERLLEENSQITVACAAMSMRTARRS